MTKSDGNVLYASEWNTIEKTFNSIGQTLIELRMTGSGDEYPSKYGIEAFNTTTYNVGSTSNLTKINAGGYCDFYYTANYETDSYSLQTGSYRFPTTTDVGSIVVFSRISEFPVFEDLYGNDDFSNWSLGYGTATGIGSGIGGGTVWVRKSAGAGANNNQAWIWYTGSDFYQSNETIYLLTRFSGYGTIANNQVQIRQDSTDGNAVSLINQQGTGYHLIKIRFLGTTGSCSIWMDGRHYTDADLNSLSNWYVGLRGDTTGDNPNSTFTTYFYFMGRNGTKNANSGPDYYVSTDECQNWKEVETGSVYNLTNTGSNVVMKFSGTIGSNVVLAQGIGYFNVT